MHRDRDFLLGPTVNDELSWDEALRLAKDDRDALAGRLADDADRPRLRLDGHYDRKQRPLRRWVWAVVNTTDGLVLAEGRAMTKARMESRRFKAYLRVDAELHAGRAEA